jgi:sugar phosphate isomerase/epimerase
MKKINGLKAIVLIGVGATLLGLSSCKNISAKKTTEIDAPAYKISLAQWSINKMIREDKISPYEFASLASKWGFEGLEYVSQLYTDVTKSDNQDAAIKLFIQKNNELSAKFGLKNILIMVDEEGNLATQNEEERLTAIKNHKKWINAAAEMGCHSMRINLFGETDPELWKSYSKLSLIKLSEYALPLNVNIIVENHGYLSSNAALLMELINEVNMKNCGTLPDFGNFCLKRENNELWDAPCVESYDNYKGIAEMMPKAFAVSAKSYDFDGEGSETTLDYQRLISIVKSNGYDQYIGIEYEGSRLSEEEGILATRDLLLKLM